MSQVGEVLRALGTNPTEGEVKKLIQTTCTSVPSRAGNKGSRSFAIAKNLRDCETSSFVSSSSNQVLTVYTCNIRPTWQEKDARVTFEMFLPMLQDVSSKPIRDTVDDFVEGLKHFDKEGNGLISAVELRHLLTGLGEKMSEEEVEQLIHGKEDSQGNINYEEFVKMVLAQWSLNLQLNAAVIEDRGNN